MAHSSISTRVLSCKMPITGAANCCRLVRPTLLVSDLDDTLIGGTAAADAGTAAFKAMWEASRDEGIDCKLAINTAGTWAEDAQWSARVGEGWDPANARAVMVGLVHTFGPHNIEYRPAEELHQHKLTVLYCKELQQQLMPQLHACLQQAGIQATVIEGAAGKGPEWQFIDLLPRNAGKGSAMRYMQQQLGFEDAATVAAGDANNDLLMLQQASQAIVVGNAVQEVKAWAHHAHHAKAVYVAEQHIAAGVLEGLQALGFMQAQLAN